MNASTGIGALRETIETALQAWLPRQRWHGGGQAITAVHCEELSAVHEGELQVAICVALVEYEDAATVRYHVPLAITGPGGVRPSDPRAVVHEDDAVLVFDALADSRSAAPIWRILAGGAALQLDNGSVVPGGAGLDPGIQDISPLVREQSNTSLVVGGDHLLKVMRKVVYEPSVELEMTRTLADAGFENIAPAEGWLDYLRDGESAPALLALVQRYLHNATEGWTLALTSLRDLYADAEEEPATDTAHRVQTVEDAGGSFTAEAARLGDITAGMHLALAAAHDDAFAAQPTTPAMLNAWADEILAELGELIDRGDASLAELAEHREPLTARLEAIRGLEQPGAAIRIHGDYHLGQVLRTDSGWTVLDFEGEPRRSVEHRRRRHSPLRDVAGMLRSFDYAASVALIERITPSDPAWQHLWAHGRTWARANREAFWAAYVERTAGTALMPDPGASLTLRRAFEIQKAIYEVGYELAHRPSWVPVPLGFLVEATA